MDSRKKKSLPRLKLRPARQDDLSKVIDLDATITKLPKPSYWEEVFNSSVGEIGHYFLITEASDDKLTFKPLIGFIVGEVRAWEFGSKPCGWVVTILVNPLYQGLGVGEILFSSICSSMRDHGVETIRTMIAREDKLNMSFFRSQGMMAGPFIELEMPLSSNGKV